MKGYNEYYRCLRCSQHYNSGHELGCPVGMEEKKKRDKSTTWSIFWGVFGLSLTGMIILWALILKALS